MPEWIRNWAAQIQVQLTQLTVSQKLLIGTLLIVVTAALFLVGLYAGTPAWVPVLDQALDQQRQQRIVNYLDTRRIKYEIVGDRVMVAPADRFLVIGALEENNLLPDDTSAGWDALAKDAGGWMRSNEQDRRLFDLAKQNVLGKVIAAYPWVRSATVILSRPENTGFSTTHQRPTAAVNIVTAGQPLDQRKVDAIAGLVSGAVAEMKAQDVTVIDAIVGRQWSVRPEGEALPTDYLDLIHKSESYHREKITTALGYIPKAIVAVSVEVDLTRKQTNSTTFDREKTVEALTSERSKTTESSEPAIGGEAGARPNTGADIAGAGGSGRTNTSTETETTFEPHVASAQVLASDPGGAPTKINATVNIPRSYLVAMFNRGKGAEAPDPADDALAELRDATIAKVKQQVEALVATTKQPGSVVVDVYPDTGGPLGAAPDAVLASGGGLLASLGGDLAYYGLTLGSVALAMFFMVLMLRSANKAPLAPTARELAGIPPVLPQDDDLVGEAGEMAAALAGVEINDEQVRQQQIVDQVGDLVRANPQQVAQILGRWMRKDA